jgi:hypothetical protein
MATYLISYDLRNQRNYEELFQAIKAYGTWAHIHQSFWAVVTTQSAEEVRDDLTQHMDSDDQIFVAKYGSEAAWRGTICKYEWLHDNLN